MDLLKRPCASDTDEHLLHLQEEFYKDKDRNVKKSSLTTTHEKSKKPLASKICEINKESGRFFLNLDAITEEKMNMVVHPIQERGTELLDNSRGSNEVGNKLVCECDAKEDGFPEVLDLSRYCASADEQMKISAADGRSLFAIEFDRLCGKSGEWERIHSTTVSSTTADALINNTNEEIEFENLQKLEAMSEQEIEKAKQEIIERFDSKTIDFLRKKAQKKKGSHRKTEEIEHKLQWKKECAGTENTVPSNSTDSANQETEIIKHLETFGIETSNMDSLKDFKTNGLDDPYVRLAANAVQMDLATKCLRAVMPRQQQRLIQLFDSFREPPKHEGNAIEDDLLKKARTNLDAIKGLYLDHRRDESGNVSVQFAEGIDPFGSGFWMLCPVRRVFDVIEKDGLMITGQLLTHFFCQCESVDLERDTHSLNKLWYPNSSHFATRTVSVRCCNTAAFYNVLKVTIQDVVIVRLALFWTLLVMLERPTLFYAFATPSQIYIRLAEIFMMGPEIFNDEYVSQCINRFLHKFLVPKAREGHLQLVLSERIAGLDIFGPFYEDLLKHFEEFSLGNDNFALFILLGAYANQHSLDGLLMKCSLWSPSRSIVRQMTIKKDSGAFLLDFVQNQGSIDESILKTHFLQYAELIRMYTAAIQNNSILRDRNPLVYEIALCELKYFVERHRTGTIHIIDTELVKKYDALVHIIRCSLDNTEL